LTVTDAIGAYLSQQRSLPFGEVRQDDGSLTQTDLGYTGQCNLDAQNNSFSLGLMDYNARFYDSYLNRWTQPDTIIPNGYDPQTLNRYAYAMDNPIRYNDPSGHLANCNGDDPGPQCYRPSDTGYKPALY